MSLWDRIKSLFRRTKINPVPLKYYVDYTDGHHEIRAFHIIDEERVLVKDVKELWRHGFVLESDKVKHVISQDDLETLLARALLARIEERSRSI